MALGESGKNLVALAAADYFFDNKVKRAFFENFTNLVPMERKGSLRKSLEWAFHLLEQGYNVLIFPEGTRSRQGIIQPFQRGLGHLVLRARVGVLPLYLDTYDALPPGAWYPQSRDVSARIGPFLPFETLSRAASGLPRSDAERVVTALVQRVVEVLRDGTSIDVEGSIEAERARYGERPGKARKNPRSPRSSERSREGEAPRHRSHRVSRDASRRAARLHGVGGVLAAQDPERGRASPSSRNAAST